MLQLSLKPLMLSLALSVHLLIHFHIYIAQTKCNRKSVKHGTQYRSSLNNLKNLDALQPEDLWILQFQPAESSPSARCFILWSQLFRQGVPARKKPEYPLKVCPRFAFPSLLLHPLVRAPRVWVDRWLTCPIGLQLLRLQSARMFLSHRTASGPSRQAWLIPRTTLKLNSVGISSETLWTWPAEGAGEINQFSFRTAVTPTHAKCKKCFWII